MGIRYYSQTGEDALLWSVFHDQERGVYVEVGAFDGRYLSNSLSFDEQGWRGVCVEPIERYYRLCVENRPRAICVNAACVGPDSPPQVEFLEEPLGILSGITADTTPDMEGRYAARGMTFPGFSKTIVPAKTLDQVLKEGGLFEEQIDFISIDTEGNEADVLAGLSVSPRILVCEANSADAWKALTDLLRGRGYTLARSLHQNLFFAQDEVAIDRLRSAAFEITPERVLHPLGAEATHPAHTSRTFRVSPAT